MSRLPITGFKIECAGPYGGWAKMVSEDKPPKKDRWKKILCMTGIMFFLLVASPAAWSQKAPDTGVLLGKRHEAAGIACAKCHQEKPSAPVPAAVCSGCHPNIAKSETIRDKLPNPHNAHMSYEDCASCHHVHKPSENQCGSCHNFEFKMR